MFEELRPTIKDCKGHDGYSVDTNGTVYSHRKKIAFKGKGTKGLGTKVIIDKTYIRVLKQSIGRGGYPQVYLMPEDRPYYVHRLVAETFIPNPENKPQVNHIDFNILNPHVDNLEWVTVSENNKHSVKHGRMGGEKCNLSKLHISQVLQIKSLLDKKMLIKDIAEMFCVCTDTISKIKHKKTWVNI